MIYKYLQGDTIQGNKYRQEGVLAQQYQEAEAARKYAEWLAQLEMRPVIVKKATFKEKALGKKDKIKYVPQVIGMSGTDPIGEFIVSGIGLGGALKGATLIGKQAINLGRKSLLSRAIDKAVAKGTKKSADYEIPEELLADWAAAFDRDMAATTIAADKLPGMLGKNYKTITLNPHVKLFAGPYKELLVGDEFIVPIGTLDRGKYAAYRAARMKNQLTQRGHNLDDFTNYTINGDRVVGRVGTAVDNLTSQPSTLYITKTPNNIGGFQVRMTGKPYVKVTDKNNGSLIRSVDVHEGVSHTTDELLKDVTKGSIEKEYGELSEAVARAGFKSQADSHHWFELRATLMQMHKKLLDAIQEKIPLPYDKLENYLGQGIDKMPVNEFASILEKINGYGEDYAKYLMLNPHTLNKFKHLLKNGLVYGAPVGLTGYGMVRLNKKGGKTHKPFGHRSILDNGWQSTKLLKNKKNVYGK